MTKSKGAGKSEDKLRIDVEALFEELEAYEQPVSEKQKDILRAAESLFAEKGFAATPTAEIAREAKVTERTLFKHFRTKADLFQRVMVPILLRTVLPLEFKKTRSVLTGDHAGVKDFLLNLAKDRVKAGISHGPRLKILFAEMLQNEPLREKVGALWGEYFLKDLRAALRRYRDAGEIRDDIPDGTVIRMMLASVLSYVLVRELFRSGDPTDPLREMEISMDVILNGIRPR